MALVERTTTDATKNFTKLLKSVGTLLLFLSQHALAHCRTQNPVTGRMTAYLTDRSTADFPLMLTRELSLIIHKT